MPRLIARRPFKSDSIGRILVRATNWVGDAVMTLPALEAVRENFPNSHLAVLAKPWVEPIYTGQPAVDQIISYPKGSGGLQGVFSIIKVIRAVRIGAFDLAILFQNAFEAALLAFLGRVPVRVGYNTDGRGLLLTHGIERDREILKVHQVEYYLSILKSLGLNAPMRSPRLHVPPEAKIEAWRILVSKGIKEGDRVVGLSPGAIFGGAKRWPAERFAIIGDWASQRWGAKVIVMGSQGESSICQAVSEAMNEQGIDLSGTTSLPEAMAVIGLCDLVLTNDSGLMHVAAAEGVPTLALFGSTDPVATGPMGPRTAMVMGKAECAPCLRPECNRDLRCMLSITPERVWEEMERMRESNYSGR